MTEKSEDESEPVEEVSENKHDTDDQPYTDPPRN